MKRIVRSFAESFCAVVLLFAAAAIPARAQSQELLQGTEVHLRLLTRLSTSVTKSGDPFIAEVIEPVTVGNQLILPKGARVNGTVGGVYRTRHFSIFRGQAAMNLSFRDLEVNSRVFPVKMSILGLHSPSTAEWEGRRRRDVKVEEGGVVEAKHDVKGDIIGGGIGIGGGTLVGAIVGHAVGGFGIGLAGSAVYIIERKGKDVVLPAQTEIMVRMDNTVTLPRMMAESSDPQSETAENQ